MSKLNMIDFNLRLETDQILLRPLELNDIDNFFKLTRDKEMWVYFTEDLSDRNTLSKWAEYAARDIIEKKRLAFTIIDKLTNAPAGSTSIGNISERDKRVEIGWTWIAKSYQGKGVNDQSKRLLLKYCFEELSCERVEFKTDVLNKHARNALLRIGAVEEGVLRSHTLMTHNRRRDTIYYSILKSEWETITGRL